MEKAYTFREACFVCSSPFQVINSISIALNTGVKGDLFIFGSFPDYVSLAEKIRHYSLFQNVHTVDLREIGVRGRFRNIKETVFAERVVRQFLDDDLAYRTLYFSSRASLKTAFLKVLLDRNPDLNRIVFEEGMGTYSDSAKLLSASPLRRVLEFFLGWHIDNPEKTEIMAYLPELVRYEAPFDKCRVTQMPRLDLTESNQRMLCDLFSVPDDGEIRERCIIFDTKRHGTSLLNQKQMSLMDKCYEVIVQKLHKENVIMKPHPRSTESCSCDIPSYPYQGIPVEVLYADMADLQHRIMVSFVSSAVFTPKILFDQETVIICLHRIVKDNRISEAFDDIFEKFKGAYRHQERVLAPASLEELEKQLDQICDFQE